MNLFLEYSAYEIKRIWVLKVTSLVCIDDSIVINSISVSSETIRHLFKKELLAHTVLAPLKTALV